MPQIPLPTTAQLTAVIEAIEATPLQALAHPLDWLRNRLDPLLGAEQSEQKIDQQEKVHPSEEENQGPAKAKREIKREGKGEAIVPNKGNNTTSKKMSTDGGQEKKRKKMERPRRSCRQEIDLMDQTYHHEKLGLPKGQQPYHKKTEKQTRDSQPTSQTREEKKSRSVQERQPYHTRTETEGLNFQPTSRTSPEDKSGSTKEQRKPELASPQLEIMKVPTVISRQPETKIRLYPEEEARVAQELQEAMANNFFKLWPLKPDTDPEINKGKRPEESREFRAPLSRESQARKLELLNQWKLKEEKDNKGRRRVQARADYVEEEMMDMLTKTDMFKPTLAPYVGTGKKIPTREEVVAEYETEYEDALEVLRPVSKSNKTSKTHEKRDGLIKKSSIPRPTHRTRSMKKIDEEIDDLEPAFAPKK